MKRNDHLYDLYLKIANEYFIKANPNYFRQHCL